MREIRVRSAHSGDLSSLISKNGEGCGDTSPTSEEKMEEEGLLSLCHQASKVWNLLVKCYA